MTKYERFEPSPGRHLALVVGIGLLGGAIYVGASGGGPVIATILTLVGASAIAGWARHGRGHK